MVVYLNKVYNLANVYIPRYMYCTGEFVNYMYVSHDIGLRVMYNGLYNVQYG